MNAHRRTTTVQAMRHAWTLLEASAANATVDLETKIAPIEEEIAQVMCGYII